MLIHVTKRVYHMFGNVFANPLPTRDVRRRASGLILERRRGLPFGRGFSFVSPESINNE